jgi:hypothetical protein
LCLHLHGAPDPRRSERGTLVGADIHQLHMEMTDFDPSRFEANTNRTHQTKPQFN